MSPQGRILGEGLEMTASVQMACGQEGVQGEMGCMALGQDRSWAGWLYTQGGSFAWGTGLLCWAGKSTSENLEPSDSHRQEGLWEG